jgi:hypothetical protein
MLKKMTQLPIDFERVADSLEQSIFEDDRHAVPAEFRLRDIYCGVASLAISQYLESLGYDTILWINEPQIKGQKGMRHVFLQTIADGERIMIDPTYGQFMGHVGLALHPMHREYYPKERIIQFSAEQPDRPVDVLIESTRVFREAVTQERTAVSLWGASLITASEEELRTEWSKIWDESRLGEWIPTSETEDIALEFAAKLLEQAQAA